MVAETSDILGQLAEDEEASVPAEVAAPPSPRRGGKVAGGGGVGHRRPGGGFPEVVAIAEEDLARSHLGEAARDGRGGGADRRPPARPAGDDRLGQAIGEAEVLPAVEEPAVDGIGDLQQRPRRSVGPPPGGVLRLQGLLGEGVEDEDDVHTGAGAVGVRAAEAPPGRVAGAMVAEDPGPVRRHHPFLKGTGEAGQGVVGQPEPAEPVPAEGDVEAGAVVLGLVGSADVAGDAGQPGAGGGRIPEPADDVAGEGQVAVGPGHQPLHVGQLEGLGLPAGRRGQSRLSHCCVSSGSSGAKRPSRMALLLSMAGIDRSG